MSLTGVSSAPECPATPALHRGIPTLAAVCRTQLPRLQGEGNGERGGEVEEGRGEKDREEERGGKSKIEEEDNMEIEKSERGRERGGKKQNKKANRV